MRQLGYEYAYEVPAYFAVSKYCNIDCSYCYLPDSNKNQKADIDRIAIQAIQQFTEKARREKFALKSVYLHGAEPTTLSPAALRVAIDMLETVTLKEKISIQTNGVALNRKYHKRLGDLSDRLEIGFTLDLPRSAHNKNRQGTYDKVLENIGIARDLGYRHRLLVCINKDTMLDLDGVIQAIDVFHREFPSMTIAFKIIKGEYQITEEQKIQWADFLCDHGLYDYDHSVWGSICQIDGNDCFWFEFCTDGGVTACNKSYNKDGIFANWMKEPMVDVLNKRLTLYQNHEIPQMCFGCKYWIHCKGGCPEDRYKETSTQFDGVANVTATRTVTLDCTIKKRIYERMEAFGMNPYLETKEMPRFRRQTEFVKWRKTGLDNGFIGE